MKKVRVATTLNTCCAHTVFVFNKLCEDATVVLKHSSWYVM